MTIQIYWLQLVQGYGDHILLVNIRSLYLMLDQLAALYTQRLSPYICVVEAYTVITRNVQKVND